MSSTRRDQSALLDIENAARQIVTFVQGFNQRTFDADTKTQSAVLYQITLLGEAVKRLSPGFRTSHPEIPWREVAGMRDRVIHQYDEVDLNQVWGVTQKDIPTLVRQVHAFMEREGDSQHRISE